MAWHWITQDVELDWDGEKYLVVDLGSDGNCLFYSLSFVFRLAGEEARTGATYREAATAQLIDWVGQLPDWFDDQHYEEPDAGRIASLIDGDWGDLTCMLAILWKLHRNYLIEILNISDKSGLADETYEIDLQAAGEAVTQSVQILYLGLSHYVALVPSDRQADIAVVGQTLVELTKTEQAPSKVSCKLSTASGLSKKINTASKDNQTALEIHQINVGVGDATLVQIQGPDGKYVKSILIDCGRAPEHVQGYFDHLLELGRFRPVDIFIATHYDNDHIGAAPAVLSNSKYVDGGLQLIDSGHPFFPSKDYDNYAMQFGEANQGKRKTADLEVALLEDQGEEIEVRIVAMNGLVRSKKKGAYQILNEAFSDKTIPKKLVDGSSDLHQWALEGWEPALVIPFDPNDTSLGIYLRFGKFRYFGAGDLNGDYEVRVVDHLLNCYLGDGHACVCKLNHHGAHESTQPSVVCDLRPRVALVSCGVPNTNGHPSPLALDRIEQLSATYPCQSLITADLSPKCPEDRLPWATPGQFKSSRDNQGSIVVLVPHALAHSDNHGFVTVTSAQPNPELHQCGERPWSEDLAIADRLPKPTRPKKLKEASLKRKAERKEKLELDKQVAIDDLVEDLRRQLGKKIAESFGSDGTKAGEWQSALEDELEDLANRLYREDEEAQKTRVATTVKNFAKNLGDFKTAQEMLQYLRKQK